jgi:hypothetical protein
VREELVRATIRAVAAHVAMGACLVCHEPTDAATHMHITTRDWEVCSLCSEGHALDYLRSVNATADFALYGSE